VDSLVENGCNMVIVIGGDGTHRGANVMQEELARRKLKICIAGVPKTIDNDIPLIDTSFGYMTSVGEATKAIEAAEVEAMSAEHGIGLVKLMGRSAGHIALGATLGNRAVNILLVKIYLVSTFNQNLGSGIQF
jgi:6-phosphofructokinase 1